MFRLEKNDASVSFMFEGKRYNMRSDEVRAAGWFCRQQNLTRGTEKNPFDEFAPERVKVGDKLFAVVTRSAKNCVVELLVTDISLSADRKDTKVSGYYESISEEGSAVQETFVADLSMERVFFNRAVAEVCASLGGFC